MNDVVQLVPARYVTLKVGEVVTGYSVAAMQCKIADAVWILGREYVRAPDGRTLLDLKGYERWAASHMAKESR